MTGQADSKSNNAGFPCPECQTFIHTDINMLLQGQLFCPSCGLKLTLTEPLTDKAREVLSDMKEKNSEAKGNSDQYP